MISSDECGNVLFSDGDRQYNLSNAESYKEFLLFVTDPSDKVSIDPDAFAVDPAAPENMNPKLSRYSDFLKDFAARRAKIISDAKAAGRTDESRKKEVEGFIAQLKGDQGTETD